MLMSAARDLMRSAAAELTGRAEAAASLAGRGSALVALLDGLLPPLAARAGGAKAIDLLSIPAADPHFADTCPTHKAFYADLQSDLQSIP